MKKLIIGIFIGFITGVFIWHFSLIHIFSYERVANGFASVTIKNQSDQKIKSVHLEHGDGLIEYGEIYKGGETRIIFPNTSENSYILNIIFENDSTLSTKGNYFERGFVGIETITNHEIISTDNW